MKAHYYHPERVKQTGYPVIIDSQLHDVILYFLELVEDMVPEAVADLEALSHEYKIKEDNDSFQKMSLLPDNWDQLTASASKEAAHITENIEAWANKYRLVDVFYKGLAWWSVSNYYSDTEEAGRTERIAEMKRSTAFTGKSESEYWANRKNEIPYKERLSLVRNCYFDDEDDHIALKFETVLEDESTGVERNYFGRYHPFIFGPDKKQWSTPNHKFLYENFLHYQELIHEKHNDEDNLPKWFEIYGFGWDPRTTSWSDFEQLIDEQYIEFKKMYRDRIESWLGRLGYIKSKEKRNMEHFKWLVRHRIQGWSLRKIADFYSNESITLNEDTISHGVKSAAELVFMRFNV